jgi:Xaa-Pro dipeptidase
MTQSSNFDRRALLTAASAVGALSATGLPAFAQSQQGMGAPKRMADAVPLITVAEREARILRAQKLMQQQGFSAVVAEGGASMDYFTGVQWGRSERAAYVVIPREGQILVVSPKFEESRFREGLVVPADVRTWEEDQNPFAVAADWLKGRKLASGKIGMEETTRAFIVTGIAEALPGAQVVPGQAIFRGCRMIKTPAEIALMQVATDITIAAYRHTYAQVKAGMTQGEISAMMAAFTQSQGGKGGFGLVLIGEGSAYPHGTKKPAVVTEGQIVLMDCGCSVGGYESDVSRTFVFGEPTKRQKTVWDQVHRGQQIAFAKAQVGTPAGEVDAAVRTYYDSLGWGPGYTLPGLSHRTGHGIGMDGHEPVNFVRGEKTPLVPGMCFSDEPGIYIPGEFGVRLEDCIHITPQGPKWFSEPPPSIDKPMG